METTMYEAYKSEVLEHLKTVEERDELREKLQIANELLVYNLTHAPVCVLQ